MIRTPRSAQVRGPRLGTRGSVDSIPALIEMVVEGRRDVEAAEVLGLLTKVSPSADDIVQALQDTLGGAEDAPTRLRITQALAEIPGTAARRALDGLTHDGDRTIAATAAAIMNMQDRGRIIER